MARTKKLSTGKLALIAYFLISAGPYGVEEVISHVGPTAAIIFICLFIPALSFPVSLICSEMGTFYSQVGSTVLWGQDIIFNMENAQKAGVRVSKGQFWFAKLFVKFYTLELFVKAIIDNSLYPVMFCQYFASVFPVLNETWPKIGVGCLCLLFVGILNVFSIDIVGWSQYVFVAIVLTPIVIFSIMGYIYGRNTGDFFNIQNRPIEMQWGSLIGNIIWQCAGFDQMTNISSEVADPRHSYPRAYAIVIFAEILTFIFPLTAGILFRPDHTNWEGDAFASISWEIPHCSNGWLYYWLIVGGAVSALAILNVSISTTSREFYCNSMTGGLPFAKWFGVLSRKGCNCKNTSIAPKKKKNRDRNNSQVSQSQVSSSGQFTAQTEPSHGQDGDSNAGAMVETVDQQTPEHREPNTEGGENIVTAVDPVEVTEVENTQQDLLKAIDYTKMGIIDEDEFNKLGLVPKRGVIALCLISVFLQVLPFDQIVEIDGFAFAFNFFLQSFLYIYAKHGQYGYVRYHPEVREDKTIFFINCKLWVSICIGILPIAIACVMTYFCLWIGYVLMFGGLAFMFLLWGVECWVNHCKKKKQNS